MLASTLANSCISPQSLYSEGVLQDHLIIVTFLHLLSSWLVPNCPHTDSADTSKVTGRNCLLCMRKNPRQQVGERKYCKFLLHHFHQGTSLPLWNEHKRVNPKWMTTYISAKISAVPTSGNSGLCIPKQWRWQGQHPYLLIPDSYSVMLDGLQGKFDKLKIPSPSYHTLTSPGWDNTALLVQVLHSIALKIVEVMLPDQNLMLTRFVHVYLTNYEKYCTYSSFHFL